MTCAFPSICYLPYVLPANRLHAPPPPLPGFPQDKARKMNMVNLQVGCAKFAKKKFRFKAKLMQNGVSFA